MKLKVYLNDKKHIFHFNPDTHWGSFIFSVREIIEKSDDELANILIKDSEKIKAAGVVSFIPSPKSEYTIIGEYKNQNNGYGWQFDIEAGFSDVKLTTYEEKRLFLEQILTDRQVNSLYSTFEDPFKFIQNEDIDMLTTAKYIGEATASRIINKFKSTMDLAPAYNFFKPLGATPLLIVKLCETYGSAENAIRKFKKNPYIIADDIKGVGFLRADEIALKYNIDKNSPFRIEAGTKYLFKKIANEKGSTWLKIDDFNNQIKDLLQIEMDNINIVIKQMIENNDIYIEDDKIALMYYYELECKIADKLFTLQNSNCEKYSEEEIKKGIEQAELEQGFEFTEEQLKGIKSVLNNNVSLVIGLAGTGKTSIIKGAYKILPFNIIINQCAFSGQASKRINEATGYPSSTIHRLLGFKGDSFSFNDKYPLNTDVVILDEVSMVGLELFWSLLQTIPNGAKLIMLGDNGQLPPIGVGNLMSDLMGSNNINLVNLTKIHRQAEKSAIITTSQKIRKKLFLLPGDYNKDETLGQLRDLHLKARQNREVLFDLLIETFMEEYNKNNKNIKDVQIIVAQNQKVALARDTINKKIQELINPKKHKSDLEIKIKYQNILRIGDKIINRENHYDVETPDGEGSNIFNGSMGIVKEIHKNYIIVDFFDEGLIVMPSDKYGGLELAYAITCHSSQGSQFDTTIVGLDNSSFYTLSNEWLYTAITRAKHNCYIVAQSRAINMAVTRNKIEHRNTFLLELLNEKR